jgi:hypothetical protein
MNPVMNASLESNSGTRHTSCFQNYVEKSTTAHRSRPPMLTTAERVADHCDVLLVSHSSPAGGRF